MVLKGVTLARSTLVLSQLTIAIASCLASFGQQLSHLFMQNNPK
jgi:hypothetical protein